MMFDGVGPTCVAVGALTAATAAAATMYLTSIPEPNCVPLVDLNNQSDELEDGSRCSRLAPEGHLAHVPYDDVRTLHDCFMRGLKISKNKPCVGERKGPNLEYQWLTYQEVYDQAQGFGSWMLAQGIKPKTDAIIGLYSQNRNEWTITAQTCYMFSLIPVALYDTLGHESSAYIINQTEMSLLVCDNAKKANMLIDGAGEWPKLRQVVVMNGLDDVNQQKAAEKNIKLISFADTIANSKKNLKDPVPAEPEEISMICYTSGTTGNPKGAILTHEAMVADLAGLLTVLMPQRPYTSADIEMSYLPLAHMYERIVQGCLLCHGGRIGYFRGDPKLLLEDLQALKPTVLPLVPRLINRIYDKVLTGVSSSKIKSKLFEWAMAAKRKELEQFVIRKNSIWDKLVFRKIQNLLGGRVEIVTTGSAPLEAKVMDFLRCAMGCLVLEGYGQTENAAALTLTIAGDYIGGHVGPPIPCNVIKLIDAPEEGYYAKDGTGEVCGRGYNIFSGYYKNLEKTAEALDSEGWLHTGDIGMWLPNGSLKIIDRRKNIFKLSQGEYVAPEKIENVFIRSKFVAQAFVDGDSLESYIMCVIVPDEEVLIEWAKNNGLAEKFSELCQSETIKDMILKDINKIGRDTGLSGFELAKDIVLHSELFSVENELLTPTFKNKRPELRKKFKAQITQLYKKHELQRQTSN